MAKKASNAEPIAVAVVEDDVRIRENLVAILALDKTIRCIGAFSSGEEAVALLPGLRPGVVFMDVNLPGIDGVACVRVLTGMLPEMRIIMLTVRQDTEVIFNALAGGASGYLLKPARAADLRAAVHDVFAGGAPMSSFIARKVVQSFQQASPPPPSADGLSTRELEVLDFLSQGFAYKEIADRLSLAYGTVHVHVSRIYKKLHVQSRGQAVARYLRQE